MATGVVVQKTNHGQFIATYEGLAQENGQHFIVPPIDGGLYVSLTGDDGGGTVTVQGSNDGTNFEALATGVTDLSDVEIAPPIPLYVRVICSSGSGGDLDAIIVGKLRK